MNKSKFIITIILTVFLVALLVVAIVVYNMPEKANTGTNFTPFYVEEVLK